VTKDEIDQAARLARPDLYAKERLGFTPHPKQAAVLRDWLGKKNSRVALRKSNEVGGTTGIIAPGILYALEILKAQVISTAGVWMQVKDQLMPALKAHGSKFPDWRFLETEINIGGISRYVGFSTRDEGFAQGFHKRPGMPLVAAIDEAAAVAPAVFNGVEERCNPDYLLISGSPLDPAGNFYDIETKHAALYTHHHFNQLDCLTKDGYWIDQASIDRKIAKWGREHPLVQSNVFGEWASRVEGALLTIGEYESCLEWSRDAVWVKDGQRHGFLDFAAGRAKNVFAVRIGNRVWIEKKWTDFNTMSAVGDFLVTFRKLQREHGLQPEECEGDADGLGKPMVDRLREAGFLLGEFRGNQAPRFDKDYQNAIAEAWGEGAAKIQKKAVIIPVDLELKGQILSRKLKRNSSGRMQLESKEDMAKRGLDSPDEADAVLGAMMPCPVFEPRQVLGARDAVRPNKNQFTMEGWGRRERQDERLPGTHC
jgi:phage terminase large subunit